MSKKCVNCGNELEDNAVFCDECGTKQIEIDTPDLEKKGTKNEGTCESKENEGIKKAEKKGFGKKWLWIVIAIVAMLGSFMAFGGSGNSKAENLVKNGKYGMFDAVTVKEVLEYNWKDGVWDSFVATDEQKTQIVEYAENKNRENYIQFAVDMKEESFRLVYMESSDGSITEKEEAEQALQNMYYNYFAYKFPVREIDLAEYVNDDIQSLLKDSNAFYEADKDFGTYEDVSHQVNIVAEDGKILSLQITGDGTYAPKFAGTTVGSILYDMDLSTLENYGYTLPVAYDETYVIYGNPEEKSMISFETDENAVIISITWVADVLDEIAGDVEETMEEVENSFVGENVDYGWIYGGVLDDLGTDCYTLYDIDKDGYLELFIEDPQTWNYQIYTTNGEDAIRLGETPSSEALFEYPDGNGFYTQYCQMGSETITRVFVEDGELVWDVVFQDGGGEEYEYHDASNMEELQVPMTMYHSYNDFAW